MRIQLEALLNALGSLKPTQGNPHPNLSRMGLHLLTALHAKFGSETEDEHKFSYWIGLLIANGGVFDSPEAHEDFRRFEHRIYLANGFTEAELAGYYPELRGKTP